MAQMQPEKVASRVKECIPEKYVAKVDYNKKLTKNINSNKQQQINAGAYNTNGGSFKFNVQAPEFVPKSHATIPISGYIYPYFQYVNTTTTTTTTNDWIYGGDQETISFVQEPSFVSTLSQKDILPEELRLKVIKQVEYQLSDMSLLANESLLKQMNKDPKGFVPISSVSATKKIKSLITNNQLTLSHALMSSSKLIVSDDGKKVKRKIPFTDKDKEELMRPIQHNILEFGAPVYERPTYYAGTPTCGKFQLNILEIRAHVYELLAYYTGPLRTVVAENLPDDHSHHNIEKIFNVAGSVKTIRVCHPQDPNTRTRGDLGISSKLHALIEFEHPEAAEKAAEKLNDEMNWRKGLRVKLLLRRSPKSVLKSRKSAFDGCFDDEDWLASELTDDSNHTNHSEIVDKNVEETLATKKTWGKGRVRARQRNQMFNGRGLLASSPQSSNAGPFEAPIKQATKGPRMPDGTKGFTMGRGKPLNINVQTGVHVV